MVISVVEALSVLSSISSVLREWAELKSLAKAEGRNISPYEMDNIQEKYELSDSELDAAIAKAEKREQSGSDIVDPEK